LPVDDLKFSCLLKKIDENPKIGNLAGFSNLTAGQKESDWSLIDLDRRTDL
jgi:hypothetical protein